MRLDGSCHCRKVSFTLRSSHPYPFNLCYCSICRKTAGGGGFAINLGGDSATMKVRGRRYVTVYRALMPASRGRRAQRSPAERHFCSQCGAALWVWDPRWPELIHPFASAIDTELPIPPERTHLMLGSKAQWVVPTRARRDRCFDGYPRESIADWHARLALTAD